VEEVLAFFDGALTADERGPLEAHLAGCPTCRALVSELARPGDTDPGSLDQTPRDGGEAPEPLLPGARLHRYEIVRPLGAGAMGQVFLATDPELKRAVAIKLLRHATEHAPFLEREAQALARLRHPNVVAVYDVGGEGSRRFVALEYVRGQTLTEWLQTPRAVRQILDAFGQAAQGLAAAHAAGLVHRDFKPDNVLVGDDGIAKVSDFGLARAPAKGGVRATGVLGLDLSAHGQVMGTPRFLAPEVFQGQAANAKSDQFAFCVALWEALAGEPPFDGPDLPSLRAAVLSGAPRPLPATHRMPPWLRPLLLRGLSRDPARRHGSMSALLRALAQALSRNTARRRLATRVLLAAGLSSVLALSLGGLGLFDTLEASAQEWLLVRTQPPWSDAVRVVWVDPAAAPPAELARVVEALAQAGAKAVVLDRTLSAELGDGSPTARALAHATWGVPLILSVPCSNDPRPDPDEATARAQVTLPTGATPARACLKFALPELPGASVHLAQDEKARSATGALEGAFALVEAGGVRVPTVAVAAYALANGYEVQQGADRLVVGPSELFVDHQGVVRTRFRLPRLDQLWSFADLRAKVEGGRVARLPSALAERFQGRYVLFGTAAASARDPGLYPDGRRAPPVLVHGELLSDLIEHQPLRMLSPVLLALLVLCFAALTGMSVLELGPRSVVLALVAPGLGALGLALLFARAGAVGAPVVTTLAILATFALAVLLRFRDPDQRPWRERLEPSLTGTGGLLSRTPGRFASEGARTQASVLVARHRDAVRADGPPEVALKRTRERMTHALRTIRDEQGRLDSPRVELLLALFDVGGRAQHAQAAARAAHRLAEAGWTCAVATGEVVLGPVGIPGAQRDAVLGPAVTQALALLAGAREGEVAFNVEAKRRTGEKRALPREPGAPGRRRRASGG
jgi:CHASE2 domain-containing sensor protein/predicted Ser/Thr protein kinase